MASASSPKVSYIVLSHRNPAQIRRLVDRIIYSDPHGHVLLHHDSRAAELDLGVYAEHPRVHVSVSSSDRRWGSYTLVADLMEAIGKAMTLLAPDWLTVLSGQDYPLRGLSGFGEKLQRSGYDAFVSAEPVAERRPDVANSGALYSYARYHYRWYRLPGWLLGWARGERSQRVVQGVLRRVSMTQPLFFLWSLPSGGGDMVGVRRMRTPFGEGLKCYMGSQWLTISRRAADTLLQFEEQHPEVSGHYWRSLLADESMLQTILLNDPELRVADYNHHYVRMTGAGQAHAATLGLADLPTLEQSGKPFARKFDIDEDAAVLDGLDDMVLGSERSSGDEGVGGGPSIRDRRLDG